MTICANCNGSGEGRYDGSTCIVCDGSGEENIGEVQCPKCAGTEHDKWGEVCKECGGDGVIYVDP